MAKNSNIVFTKTFSSYGINIVNTYSDFDLIGKELTSSPLVYYYNSFGKAIFDYSQTVSNNDLDLLEIFLQGITNGNTFSVSNGYYVKEQDGITSTINGIYQFDGATGNNIILTTVVSATGINNSEYRYESEYFVNPPKLDLNTGFTGDTAYIIKSVTNHGEVTKLGLYEDDLIEISYAGNTANLDRLNVEKVEISTDGEEFIFLKEPVISDNRTGLWTTINVYTRGNASSEFLSTNLNLNGIATTYDKTGTLLDCFENQNELQAYLRKFNYTDTEISSVWGYGGICPEIPVSSVNNRNRLTYDKLFSVKYGRTGFIINDVPNLEFSVNMRQKYLFYQGDISNSLSVPPQLVFSKVRNNTAERYLLKNNYQVYGIPGRSDSAVLLTITPDLPTIFYYENLNSPGKGGVIRLIRTENTLATISIN